eukprot:768450-Hanusia_phi.AAC.1
MTTIQETRRGSCAGEVGIGGKELHSEGGKFFESSPAISCLDKLSLLQNVMTTREKSANDFMVQILREEEKHAYEKSLNSGSRGQSRSNHVVTLSLLSVSCHLLTQLHNSAVYQKGLCRIIETCQLPLLSALEAEIQSAEQNLEALRREKEELKIKIAACRKEYVA